MRALRRWMRLAGSARSRVLLVLIAVTVAVVTALAAALPPLAADAAGARLTRDLSEAAPAGRSLSVTTIQVPPPVPVYGSPFDAVTEGVEQSLGPQALSHLSPVIPSVTTVGLLPIAPAPLGDSRVARLVLSPAMEDGVRWVEGRAPGGGPGGDVVEVGIAATTARAFGTRIGDAWSIPVLEGGGERLPLVVSGFYEPLDSRAAMWADYPDLLDVVPTAAPQGGTARRAALLVSARDHRRLRESRLQQPLSYDWMWLLEPGSVGPADVPALESAVTRLGAATTGRTGDLVAVRAGLLSTLDRWQSAVRTARVVDGAVTTGLLVLGVPLLLMLARLRAADRRDADRLLAARGASRRQLAFLAVVDAAPAVLTGALAGYAAAVVAAGRLVPAWWAILVVLVVLAGVVGATLATPDEHRVRGRVRRVAAAVGMLLLLGVTAVAVVSLRTAADETGPGSEPQPDLLAQSLPVLVAVCAGVVLVVLLRVSMRLIASHVEGRGVGTWLGLLQSVRAPSATLLPVVAITVAGALTVWLTSVSHTLTQELESQTWRETGAAVRVEGSRIDPPVIDAIRADAGVRALAPLARRSGEIIGSGAGRPTPVDVLLGSAAEVREVRRDTPVADAGGPPRAVAGAGIDIVASEPLPAADRGDAVLVVEGRRLPLSSVVVDPNLAADRPVVLAPRDAVEEALGRPVETTLVLVAADEPTASRLAAELPASSNLITAVTDRAALARSRAAEPLSRHVAVVVIVTALAALLLAALAAHALTAATATARRRVLARARILGMPPAQRRALVLVQVLPAALAAVVTGLLVGIALPLLLPRLVDVSAFTFGPPWPIPTPSWWVLAAIGAALVLLVSAVIAVDLRSTTTGRLTSHLRAGDMP